ncbi:MAG: tetratricopeptide repeat protein [Acidobacteria bacterium]|nr:tetratricopeptide repeat protein [Acidobacteriota bacterium]
MNLRNSFRSVFQLVFLSAVSSPLIAIPAAAQEATPEQTEKMSPRQVEEARADIMMARKQFSEATDLYLKLSAAEPTNPVLMNKIGIAFYQQEKLGPAKKYYERAVKLKSDYASAVNNIGTVEYHRKKYGSAVKYYKQAIALQPDVAAFHTNLGYAYYQNKKYEEMMKSFRQALAIDPMVFERKSNSGTILQHRNVQDRAFFYLLMAKNYAQMGNLERCGLYLLKARDEGFKKFNEALQDPIFAAALQNATVRETLNLPPLAAGVQPPPK